MEVIVRLRCPNKTEDVSSPCISVNNASDSVVTQRPCRQNARYVSRLLLSLPYIHMYITYIAGYWGSFPSIGVYSVDVLTCCPSPSQVQSLQCNGRLSYSPLLRSSPPNHHNSCTFSLLACNSILISCFYLLLPSSLVPVSTLMVRMTPHTPSPSRSCFSAI